MIADAPRNKADNGADRKADTKVNGNHWRYLLIGFSIGGWLMIFVDHIFPLIIYYIQRLNSAVFTSGALCPV